MNDSDFLFLLYVLHHFLSLLKVGQQGFPALRRFLSSQHLAFVIPLQQEGKRVCVYCIYNIWVQKSQQLVSFFTAVCAHAEKLKTTIDLRGANSRRKRRKRHS